MDTIEVLNNLFDQKILRIMKLFLTDRERELYLREIAKKSKVPVATTYRILNKLLKLNIIKQLKIKKFKFYRAADNDTTKFLETFLKEETQIVNIFVKKTSELEGVNSIILHGKETRDRANLLVIGEGIKADEIKRICAGIKEKYKFSITSLALTREQYDQMTAMGLYSGLKKVLYKG